MLVQVDGHKIYYQYYNEKLLIEDYPVVIMLHDGLGSVKQWKGFPELLSERIRFPVLVYDRVGYGISSGKEQMKDIKFLEADESHLEQLIDKLNLSSKKLILFGHSDGGTIALRYAGLNKSNVVAVISLAAHVFAEEITRKGVKEMVRLYESGKLKDKLFVYHGDNTDSMFYDWASAWTNESTLTWNIFADLEKIKTPVLAIQGLDDEYGTPLQLAYIEKLVSERVQSVLLESCAHMPHIQKTNEVLQVVESFLIKHSIISK